MTYSTTTSTTWCASGLLLRCAVCSRVLFACLQYVWATRRDAAYLRYLALHFTVHGAVPRLGAAGSGSFADLPDTGFFVFYTSIFSMFCPLWEGETTLSGLRMVRNAASCPRLVCDAPWL